MESRGIRFPRIPYIVFMYVCSLIGFAVMWATDYPLYSWSGTVLIWITMLSILQLLMSIQQRWFYGRFSRRLECMAEKLSIDLSRLHKRSKSSSAKLIGAVCLLLVVLSEIAVVFGGSLLITSAMLSEFGLAGFSRLFVTACWWVTGVGVVGQVAWTCVIQYLIYALGKVVVVRRQETRMKVRRMARRTQPVSNYQGLRLEFVPA